MLELAQVSVFPLMISLLLVQVSGL
jgi:hypothetical protein